MLNSYIFNLDVTDNILPDLKWSFLISHFKIHSIHELRFATMFDHTYDEVRDKFVEAIIKAGSPSEIVELRPMVHANYLRTLCDCSTLQSLVLTGDFSRDECIIGEVISKNHSIASLRLDSSCPVKPKAMVEKILSVERKREKCDQNIENVLEFFQRSLVSSQVFF